MSSNKCYLFWFVLTINLTGIIHGYSASYYNQAIDLINVKLGYTNSDQSDVMDAYLGSCVIFGMMIGSLSGGILMKIGRRRSLMLACLLGIVGVLMTWYMSFYMLLSGRILFGISTGLFSCIGPKFVEETIPIKLYDQFTVLYLSCSACGGLIGNFSGELLPPNTNEALLSQDNNWKIIIVYFPLAQYALILLLFTTIITNDSIKFLIN